MVRKKIEPDIERRPVSSVKDKLIEAFLLVTFIGLIVTVILFLTVSNVRASELPFIPDRAKQYLPSVIKAIDVMKFPKEYHESIAGQIEQETCYSLKHKKCWNPNTELKTSREYGFGLGQLTITSKFNGFQEVTQYKELKEWKWEDRYNPELQIRAILLKDRIAYNAIKWPVVNEYEKLAMAYAAYNGGVGGLLSDRKLTQLNNGDTSKWFGGIELYSKKSKVPHPEYKVSFFDINRSYPKNILTVRMMKYKPWMEKIRETH